MAWARDAGMRHVFSPFPHASARAIVLTLPWESTTMNAVHSLEPALTPFNIENFGGTPPDDGDEYTADDVFTG